jgi:tetratricopeptide (TPR) repeat protein
MKKTTIALLLAACTSLGHLRALDTIHLVDGDPITGNVVDIRGDQLRVDRDLGRGTATVTYPLSRVQKIIFSEEKRFSSESLPADPAQRLEATNILWIRSRPFLKIPESDAGAIALVRARALVDLGKHNEAITLIDEVTPLDWNPRRKFLYPPIKIRALAALDRFEEALALSRQLQEESADPGSMAFIQLILGQVELSRKDFTTALDHYLYNRIMNPQLHEEAAQGLLGAAQAFLGLEKPRDAVRMLQDLLSDYPKSSVAAEAEKLLKTTQEKYKDILTKEEPQEI